jgi:hypothetical protein
MMMMMMMTATSVEMTALLDIPLCSFIEFDLLFRAAAFIIGVLVAILAHHHEEGNRHLRSFR